MSGRRPSGQPPAGGPPGNPAHHNPPGRPNNPLGLSLNTDRTNHVQLSNISTGPEVDDYTEDANTVLERRLPRATYADWDYLNAKARDKLLLGWKFVRQMGRGQWAIASHWQYKPSGPQEMLLEWTGDENPEPVKDMVVKQANGGTAPLINEANIMEMFTKFGCRHWPRLYDNINIYKNRSQGNGRIENVEIHRIMMEFFPNGSLGDYLLPYVLEKPDQAFQGLDELQNWRQNIRYGERESEKRIEEKALWSLFVCLAKSVLAAETGREYIPTFDSDDLMKGRVFIPLDLKPDNVLVAAADDGSDIEHKYFPRVVWTDFALSLMVPRDWSLLSAQEKAAEAARLKGKFSQGLTGDQWFMSPEQREGDATKLGTKTNVYLIGALMWWCIELPKLPPRYEGDIIDDNDNSREENDYNFHHFDMSQDKLRVHTCYSKELLKLIGSCISKSIEDRPSAHTLLRMTIDGLAKCTTEDLTNAYRETGNPQQQLLVPRLKSEYNYWQTQKRELAKARALFKKNMGRAFVGKEVARRRTLKSGKNIADEAHDWLADGLCFVGHRFNPNLEGARQPTEEQHRLNTVQLYNDKRREIDVEVHVRVWLGDTRVANPAKNYAPHIKIFGAQKSSKIKDLRTALKRKYHGTNDAWLPNAIVHIFPYDDERHLEQDILLSDIQRKDGEVNVIELEAIVIKRRNIMDRTRVRMPRKPEELREQFDIDPQDLEDAENMELLQIREEYYNKVRQAKALAKEKNKDVTQIDVAEPFTVNVFLWPKSGRSERNVKNVIVIPVTIAEPWNGTIKELHAYIEEVMKKKYKQELASNEDVRIFESGPFNAIYAGSKHPLPGKFLVVNIVMSRERNKQGKLIVRNLDAVVYTSQEEAGSKRKRVGYDWEVAKRNSPRSGTFERPVIVRENAGALKEVPEGET